jgi:hypothetical protein
MVTPPAKGSRPRSTLQRLARDPKEIHWIDTGHTAITLQYRHALAAWLRGVL